MQEIISHKQLIFASVLDGRNMRLLLAFVLLIWVIIGKIIFMVSLYLSFQLTNHRALSQQGSYGTPIHMDET